MTPRLIAVGDIHGSSDQFDALMDAVKPTTADTLVFLGDYVDRGPDTRGVLDRLIFLKRKFHVVCLLGNHELLMLRARADAGSKRMWLSVGGLQALASYGSAPGRTGTMDDIPEAHWHFLERDCVDWLETEDFLFVHAGVVPSLTMDEQSEAALFWEFLDPAKPIYHFSGKTVICGHTSQKSGKILDLGSTICLDTYAYGGGHLSALDCLTGRTWQANLLGRVTTGQLRASSS